MGPDDPGRLVRDHLDALGCRYELVACDPALADTTAFCQAYGYDLEDSANTIVVVGKSDPPAFAACVVLATTRLDVNHAVRARLGVRKASFASPEQTVAVTGMVVGGVTPFGLPPELALWVDARVMTRPRIVLGGGDRRAKIVGAPEMLRKLDRLEVVRDLALERP